MNAAEIAKELRDQYVATGSTYLLQAADKIDCLAEDLFMHYEIEAPIAEGRAYDNGHHDGWNEACEALAAWHEKCASYCDQLAVEAERLGANTDVKKIGGQHRANALKAREMKKRKVIQQ